MRNRLILISISLVLAVGIFVYLNVKSRSYPKIEINNQEVIKEEVTKDKVDVLEIKEEDDKLVMPLERSAERVSKKPFGIFITKDNSPVQPERFGGYHTGVDFEVFPEELSVDVPVRAVCAGEIIKRDRINGYGGVLVQSCEINNEKVTIIYGHLDLNSITKKVGDNLVERDFVANLGRDKSIETDRERKHLHLGIHKGSTINFLGYVQDKNQLENWINGCKYFCGK